MGGEVQTSSLINPAYFFSDPYEIKKTEQVPENVPDVLYSLIHSKVSNGWSAGALEDTRR